MSEEKIIATLKRSETGGTPLTFQTIRAAALGYEFTGDVNNLIERFLRRGILLPDDKDYSLYHIASVVGKSKRNDPGTIENRITNKEIIEDVYSHYRLYRAWGTRKLDAIYEWLDGWKREIGMGGLDKDEFYAYAEERLKSDKLPDRTELKIMIERKRLEKEAEMVRAYLGR